MKKFSTLILSVLLITAMCVPAFADTAGSGGKGDSSEVYGQSAFDNQLTAASKTMKIKKTKKLSASIKYPVIKGMEDKKVQKAVNKVLLKEAKSALNNGRKAASKLKKKSTAKAETNVDFSVKYNQNGLLSIVMHEYQFAGGANGTNKDVCKNFDLSTGKEVKLKDLCTDFDKGKDAINKSVRAGINAAKTKGLEELKPFKSISNKQDYYFSPEGLVVVFQQDCAYFSHSDGVQTFTVPYADIAACLKADYMHLALTRAELDAAKTTELSEGQLAYIVVDSNPTTGYSWTVKSSDEKIVKVVKQQYLADPEGKDLAGAGGKEIIVVKAMTKGSVKLQCTYEQNWDGGSKEKPMEYNIVVK